MAPGHPPLGADCRTFPKTRWDFFLREAHPLAEIFDDTQHSDRLIAVYDYFHKDAPLHYIEKGTYAQPDAALENDAYYWLHSLSDIFSSLLQAGLEIRQFEEYPYLDWQQLPMMVARSDGYWELPPKTAKIPLMFSLKAEKPA